MRLDAVLVRYRGCSSHLCVCAHMYKGKGDARRGAGGGGGGPGEGGTLIGRRHPTAGAPQHSRLFPLSVVAEGCFHIALHHEPGISTLHHDRLPK